MAAPNPKPSQVLVIDDTDNVATTLAALAAGRELLVDRCGRAHRVLLKDEIPMGHKFALDPIAQGEPVRKYGVVIARAMAPIEAGQHVHVHNVESNRGRGDRA
jgi:altronate dehydratase small subunit